MKITLWKILPECGMLATTLAKSRNIETLVNSGVQLGTKTSGPLRAEPEDGLSHRFSIHDSWRSTRALSLELSMLWSESTGSSTSTHTW